LPSLKPKTKLLVSLQKFEKAISQQFAMIDVNKNHMLAKKKSGDDKLELVNELKIISAPDDLFSLWSEVIIVIALGELYDSDKDIKFNEREN